jgi:nicotinamide-nucleotide amidase
MKASVLAVGTELTSGQITNRNAAWISKHLSQFGLQTEIHITVADDRDAILEALLLLERKSDLIFVTGGLGPTSDDFTRELIMKWAEKSSFFHEASWEKIKARLQLRGIPIADFQKQQCYFPETSHVLENSQGTANAFYLQKGSKYLWALPGPPNEIAAVWKDHVETQIKQLTKDLNPYVTVSWDALGLGEALAPSLVEPAVQNSGADIGYRVHLPYLEIKFSYYKSEHVKMLPFIEKIEMALAPYTVSRNGQDILENLKQILPLNLHFFVLDEVTEGLLFSRLQTIQKHNLTFTTDKNLIPPQPGWKIHVSAKNDSEIEIEISALKREPLRRTISSPYSRNQHMTERRRQYFTEMILVFAVEFWGKS